LIFGAGLFIIIFFGVWIGRLVQDRLDLAKIIAELRERHPDDSSFRIVHKRPDDPPEMVRFRVRNAASNVFEIAADGSRATIKRIRPNM
jgi:hypothetical protein